MALTKFMWTLSEAQSGISWELLVQFTHMLHTNTLEITPPEDCVSANFCSMAERGGSLRLEQRGQAGAVQQHFHQRHGPRVPLARVRTVMAWPWNWLPPGGLDIFACNFLNFGSSSPKGSDCGIVNVNIPTSGAEIGGAFGERAASASRCHWRHLMAVNADLLMMLFFFLSFFFYLRRGKTHGRWERVGQRLLEAVHEEVHLVRIQQLNIQL